MLQTPKELGYYMPGEWEKHSAVWLAWPYGDITFPDHLKEVEFDYCEIIKILQKSEKVKLILLKEEKDRIMEMLAGHGVNTKEIIFYTEDYADVWTRDYVPISLFHKETKDIAYVNWNYNAYGKMHDPRFVDLLKDDKIFHGILSDEEHKVWKPGIVLEGGAVESNGKGTLMTTEQCLLHTNRNQNLDKGTTEKYLKDYLGVENIIWLKDGLTNDHTDGHIDEIARFVSVDTIVCGYEDDVNDVNYKILEDNFRILESATDQDGNKFKIIKLPMPHMNYSDGEKAPVSYTNFYIGNSIILMSIFNDTNDEKAMDIMQEIFPNHKVIGFDCSRIIYGGGAIHCITMQEYLKN